MGYILVAWNKAIVVNKWIIVVDALIVQTCPLYEIEDDFILHSFWECAHIPKTLGCMHDKL